MPTFTIQGTIAKATIYRGRRPFEWWYEISYTEADGVPVHDWERDGGAFGLWRCVKKAEEAIMRCEDEIFSI